MTGLIDFHWIFFSFFLLATLFLLLTCMVADHKCIVIPRLSAAGVNKCQIIFFVENRIIGLGPALG